MKVALCFTISGKQEVSKEQIWQDWIKPNKDIITIYFHYKNYSTIKSEWIKDHAINPKCIVETSYFHMVPAYITLMNFAITHDSKNQWFIFLTESCVPIISPQKFRNLFFNNLNKTIMSWKPCWWNVHIYKRANLHGLKSEFHLANNPWFILKKEDALKCIHYSITNKQIYNFICKGIIANESIFAIILKSLDRLKYVQNSVTHASDWARMSSGNSPYVFDSENCLDIPFIEKFLKENPYTMFLRKVDSSFPSNILLDFINRNDVPIIVSPKKIISFRTIGICISITGFFIFLWYYNK